MNENALNVVTEKIIGCAIEVHRNLGPGLLETIYEKALCREFELLGIRFGQQVPVPIMYKGESLGEMRLDILVEDAVIVELKAVDRIEQLFRAQLLTYLRLTGKKLGLLINFNSAILKDGITRVIL